MLLNCYDQFVIILGIVPDFSTVCSKHELSLHLLNSPLEWDLGSTHVKG